jgi:hypothetical protein
MLTDLTPTSKDTIWQTGLKRKIQKSKNRCFPSHRQKQAVAEGKRLEEDLPNQWPSKTGRSSNTYLEQNRLQLTLIK